MSVIERIMKFLAGTQEKKVLPSRNDLCWCGSGIKYKRCHLEKDAKDIRSKKGLG